MEDAITKEHTRAADQFAIQRLKIPSIVLMENAGRGCAEKLLAVGCCPGVVICCGGGNNGGDGFVIARHLLNHRIPVKVILLTPPESYKGDAAANLRVIERMRAPIVQFDASWSDERLADHLSVIGRENHPNWIVDAMLGTGATGELRRPIDQFVRVINQSCQSKMAIDVPTGLDCDTGVAIGDAIKADLTCTFIANKAGFSNAEAEPYLGHVSVVGIGAPESIVERTAKSDD